jgi:hypothetical protein
MPEHADIQAIDFLTTERTAIVDDALDHVTSRHYDAEDALEVRLRLETLFECVLDSLVMGDLRPIDTYARQIAEERFAAGYDLSEVQSAFNALESATWTRALAELPPERLARTLGLVSTIVGAGKDTLGATYVSLATDAHAPSLDLRALFAGASA